MNIPKDALICIFINVPPSCFAKCKRVCSLWNRILSSPEFWWKILKIYNIKEDQFVDRSPEWLYWSYQPIPKGKDTFSGVACKEGYRGEFAAGLPKGYGIVTKEFVYYGEVSTING